MANCVANSIRRIITEKGLVQGKVAERAGFSDQQLCDMLADRKIIRAEYVPALAAALGVTPNDLFYNE